MDSESFRNQLEVPTEIIEHIINHLIDDRDSLKACTLVSRQWLPTSRLHFIPSIRVNRENHEELLGLLDTPYSLIACWVRELDIAAYRHQPYDWLDKSLPTLAAHFGQITSVKFRGIIWNRLQPESQGYLHTAFRRSKQLEFWSCRFSSLAEIVENICSFPILEGLRCNICSCAPGDTPISVNLKISPYFKDLVISDVDRLPLFSWLESQRPPLENLTVGTISTKTSDGVNSFFALVGPSLRSAQFGFAKNFMDQRQHHTPALSTFVDTNTLLTHLLTVYQPFLDLSHNTNLKNLIIKTLDLSAYGLSGIEKYSLLPALLHSISSSSLSELAVELNLFYSDDLSGISWTQIDAIFNDNPSFRDVQKFLVGLRHVGMTGLIGEKERFMAETENILASQLRNITKRGLLEVRYLGSAR
jgi:hypothetical protein